MSKRTADSYQRTSLQDLHQISYKVPIADPYSLTWAISNCVIFISVFLPVNAEVISHH